MVGKGRVGVVMGRGRVWWGWVGCRVPTTPNPNPIILYPSPPLPPLHPYPSPLLHYPTLLGYVRLGKDER